MIISFIQRAVMQGIPLLFGSTGEILTEKSGNLNLGTAGVMYVGGISGVIGAFLYEQNAANFNPVLAFIIPFISSIIGSLFMGLIYSVLTVTLRANQNVTGLALTTFGVGFGNFFGGSLIKLTNSSMPSIVLSKTSLVFKTTLPFASKLGWFGEVFFSYSFLAYFSIAIAIVMSFYFNRTRSGLNLRAVGENPATADAAGISVTKYRYVATIIGSGIAGLGGLGYIMDNLGGNWEYTIDAIGWLAIALVIFSLWKPNLAIIGSFVFGALYKIGNYLPGISTTMKPMIKMLPFVVTILVLIITSIRNKKENQAPEGLGLSYFREER